MESGGKVSQAGEKKTCEEGGVEERMLRDEEERGVRR